MLFTLIVFDSKLVLIRLMIRLKKKSNSVINVLRFSRAFNEIITVARRHSDSFIAYKEAHYGD